MMLPIDLQLLSHPPVKSQHAGDPQKRTAVNLMLRARRKARLVALINAIRILRRSFSQDRKNVALGSDLG